MNSDTPIYDQMHVDFPNAFDYEAPVEPTVIDPLKATLGEDSLKAVMKSMLTSRRKDVTPAGGVPELKQNTGELKALADQIRGAVVESPRVPPATGTAKVPIPEAPPLKEDDTQIFRPPGWDHATGPHAALTRTGVHRTINQTKVMPPVKE